MSVFKNVTDHTIRVATDGVNPEGIKEVAPGKLLTLDDRLDYLIGVETGPGQFVKVDVEALAAAAEGNQEQGDQTAAGKSGKK